MSEQAPEQIPEELPQYAQVDDLGEGVKAWTNPQNGFRVLRLHMSANPAKRSPEYDKEIQKGISHAQYLREYHLVWRSFEGRAVYMDDWNRNFHVSKDL